VTRLKELFREPALLIDLGETLVVFLIAFGIGGFTGDDQSYLVAAIIGLVGLGKAFTTKPFAVTALTDATRAILVCAAAVFGVGLSADQIAIAATLVGTLFSLIARAQITPRRDPVVVPGGAGAGPVAGEAGAANVLYVVGAGLLILAFILLVTTLLKVFVVSIPLLVVLAVIGVVLLLVSGAGGVRRF
jgi:hypothetical protein